MKRPSNVSFPRWVVKHIVAARKAKPALAKKVATRPPLSEYFFVAMMESRGSGCPGQD